MMIRAVSPIATTSSVVFPSRSGQSSQAPEWLPQAAQAKPGESPRSEQRPVKATSSEVSIDGRPAPQANQKDQAEPQTEETPETSENSANEPTDPSGEPLDMQEKQTVARLQTRDREVRAHEQAHLAAAGPIAVSAAQYQYATGPDGRRYAVGGEVRIDVSRGSTPEETIIKAQAIRRAALAPAQPSGQDRAVAAAASRMESEARAELARENQPGREKEDETVEETSQSESSQPTNPTDRPTSPASARAAERSGPASRTPAWATTAPSGQMFGQMLDITA